MLWGDREGPIGRLLLRLRQETTPPRAADDADVQAERQLQLQRSTANGPDRTLLNDEKRSVVECPNHDVGTMARSRARVDALVAPRYER